MSERWWALSIPVVHGVLLVKEHSQPLPIGSALRRPDFSGIGIHDDFRLAMGADGQKSNRVLSAIGDLMGAALSDRKGEHIALAQLPPTVRIAQQRGAGQYDEDFFFGEVEVIRVRGLTGRHFP